MSYWVTFKNKHVKPVCVDASSVTEALEVLGEHPSTAGAVDQVRILPYPAMPRINTKPGACPTFCFTPERCAGHSSCPRDYACSD